MRRQLLDHIAAGGDGLTDYRKSICGQLFILRADMARRIGLPAGLPVEDGFFRAMIVTDLLSGPERLDVLDGDPGVFHVYESIRTPGDSPASHSLSQITVTSSRATPGRSFATCAAR